jgi:hypothetical protein
LAAEAALTRRELPAYLRGLLRQAAELDDERLDVRSFSVAGLRIEARFTDAGMADLYSGRLVGPATEAGPPDLRVDVLEASRIGWPPPAGWSDERCPEDFFERLLLAAGLRAAYPYQPRLWQVYDEERGAALQLAGAASDLPLWDSGAPLRLAIHWALPARGRRLLHGATLGTGSDGILISGPGGIGKSGTALAGIAHGLRTVGDDYVIVEQGVPPIAWPVYRLFKQDPAGVARLAGVGRRLAGRPLNWQGKLEFDPEELSPGCMAHSLRLRAILVPSIERLPASRVEPMPRGKAIEAIARSTIVQLASERASVLLFCAGLTARLPVFRLSLSEEPSEIAATIAALIEDLAG